MRAPLLVVVGVAVLGVGASCGLLDDAETPSAGPPAPVQLDVGEVLDLTPGCRRDLCHVVERRDGFRYDGRRVALLAVAHPEACRGGQRTSFHLAVGEEVLWSSEAVVCGDAVRGVETDATGHAFLAFGGAGRDDTLVVLRVEGEGVKDFGSLQGAFAGHRVGAADDDGDGAREITVTARDGSRRTWRWTGSAYEETDPDGG